VRDKFFNQPNLYPLSNSLPNLNRERELLFNQDRYPLIILKYSVCVLKGSGWEGKVKSGSQCLSIYGKRVEGKFKND